jgi:hypothetical protein
MEHFEKKTGQVSVIRGSFKIQKVLAVLLEIVKLGWNTLTKILQGDVVAELTETLSLFFFTFETSCTYIGHMRAKCVGLKFGPWE